ncbi:hypothetical protein [Cecembia calidifontis]|uniref:Uncharacterized protein n=1 Tax=Cecembia calidifontis TaxID=1187080 RepID=A0A4Q7PA58_9BACT|nr:hypothetical protein [Cecembia calidifontis]RZS96420.1 hypothetical protein BC751_1991 [Cecembia calidifontis]
MQGKVENLVKFALPEEIIHPHYCKQLPPGFPAHLSKGGKGIMCNPQEEPSLYTAHLPEVLEWLHGLEKPTGLEEEPCEIPVLLFDKEMSTESLLFHYDGTPPSARLIRNFVELFQNNIKDCKATIISPSFIPKSKLREEQEIVQLLAQSTAETSFIKFNFTRIGDFWSYAVKHKCTLLVTTKYYQADLAKVLFHFYRGGMWYDRLSFYLSY